MSEVTEKAKGPCGPGCTRCGVHEPPTGASPLEGGRLVAASLGVFMLPLVLAIVGAAVAGGEGTRQLLGALGGLVVGLAGGVCVARLARRAGGEERQ
ncbi:MAG TPA: SoxR reducing system RseC family protein [Phycisphaerae bacterium]|nr:SoxR reducing system RseC family protein [Phycisphaerae bacterium]